MALVLVPVFRDGAVGGAMVQMDRLSVMMGSARDSGFGAARADMDPYVWRLEDDGVVVVVGFRAATACTLAGAVLGVLVFDLAGVSAALRLLTLWL